MDIATGLVSLILAFVFMYAGGLQYALDRGEVARILGGWAVGRTWYEVKAVGVLAMAGGGALILPMLASVPEFVRPAGAAILAVITLVALVGHLRRLQMTRAVVNLALADLAVGLALFGAL
ncbi:MAG: hypothetical protein GY838_14540 [bacterium]|nr:hypothetical protein [bacterium]